MSRIVLPTSVPAGDPLHRSPGELSRRSSQQRGTAPQRAAHDRKRDRESTDKCKACKCAEKCNADHHRRDDATTPSHQATPPAAQGYPDCATRMNEERTVRSKYVSTYSENPPTVGDTSASDSIKATERTQSVTVTHTAELSPCWLWVSGTRAVRGREIHYPARMKRNPLRSTIDYHRDCDGRW